ncbi:molecular chaperone Hsp33 [Pycnococcus provasolii]
MTAAAAAAYRYSSCLHKGSVLVAHPCSSRLRLRGRSLGLRIHAYSQSCRCSSSTSKHQGQQTRRCLSRASSSSSSSSSSSQSESPESPPVVVFDTPRTAGDEVLKTISANGEATVLTCLTTDLVKEGVRRHKTAPAVAAALGRVVTGTMLMGVFRGDGDECQVSIEGKGPVGSLTAISTHDGKVRARVINPFLYDAKSVPEVVGNTGVVRVVRSNPLAKAPYTGVTPIQTGEIGEDLTHYLLTSEQQRCAMGLGVALEVGKSAEDIVASAGGFLVQVLPFAGEETIKALEENIADLGSVTERLADGMRPGEMAAALMKGDVLSGGEDEQLAQFSLEPSYGPCETDTLKPRMEKMIRALGRKEADAIVEEVGSIEVRCDFCMKTLEFTKSDVEVLFHDDNL